MIAWDRRFLCTCIYTLCARQARARLWDALTQYGNNLSFPWILMGDYNVIADWEEKKGGVRRDDGSMRDFVDFIQNLGLIDIGVLGKSLSWCNNRQGLRRVYKRLDRVLLNSLALSALPDLRVRQLDRVRSDHCPLLLEVCPGEPRKNFFSFHSMWLDHEGFMPLVKSIWCSSRSSNPMFCFSENLKVLRKALRVWNWSVFGDLNRKAEEATHRVDLADSDIMEGWTEEKESRLIDAQAELSHHLRAKYQLLEEKSRLQWLKGGEKNTTIFHTAMKVRRAQSRCHIELPDGSWSDDRHVIGAEAVKVFEELLGPVACPIDEEVLSVVPEVLAPSDSHALIAVPSLDEIREVVWSMDAKSAPGSDGFTVLFYQECSEVIAPDLLAAVTWFFQPGNYLPRSVTSTHIVLLPKVKLPQSLNDFRPVSLCNVLHKIILKLLNNRLSRWLPKLIGEEQAGFVQGRSIHEAMALGHEVVSDIDKKVRGGNIVLKLDMSKAYDRLSWAFLIRILRRFGFSNEWCDIIYRHICGCYFSIKWGGELFGFFRSYKGVRQGDPISSSLFVLAMDVFGRMINKAMEEGVLKPFAGRYRVKPPSHLLFADDVMVFSNGSVRSVRHLSDIIDSFCASSGQVINSAKSAIFFSKWIPGSRRSVILHNTGFAPGSLPISYLGAPLFAGRSRQMFFDGLVQKIRNRVEGWASKLLSFGGRITLIKSVLLSMPIHVLSAIPVPMTVIKRLNSIFASFLWNAGKEKRHHWVAWSNTSKPIDQGGIGICSLRSIMESFQAKLAWRFWEGSSLWARFVRAKYEFVAQPGTFRSRGSAVWQAILPLVQLLRGKVRWVFGRGDVPLGCAFPGWAVHSDLSRIPVHRVISDGSVMNMLSDAQRFEVSGIVLDAEVADRLVWENSSSGCFSASSFRLWVSPSIGRGDLKWIWSSFLPMKVSGFLWRLFNNAVAVDQRIQSRGIQLASRCRCCSQCQEESVDHLFITSQIASELWGFFARVFDKPRVSSIFQLRWSWVGQHPPKSQLEFMAIVVVACGLWEIWCERNFRMFDDFQFRQPLIRRVQRWCSSLSYLIKPSVVASSSELSALSAIRVSRIQVPSVKIRWVSWDPGDDFTLNVDGSVSLAASSGGGVIRDSSGFPKLLCSFRFDNGISSVKAEFLAALRGLQEASSAGLLVSEVQTDSRLLADAVNGTSSCPWECCYLLRSIRGFLRGAIVRHIYREANQVADALASEAYSLGNVVSSATSAFSPRIRALLLLDQRRTASSRIV